MPAPYTILLQQPFMGVVGFREMEREKPDRKTQTFGGSTAVVYVGVIQSFEESKLSLYY